MIDTRSLGIGDFERTLSAWITVPIICSFGCPLSAGAGVVTALMYGACPLCAQRSDPATRPHVFGRSGGWGLGEVQLSFASRRPKTSIRFTSIGSMLSRCSVQAKTVCMLWTTKCSALSAGVCMVLSIVCAPAHLVSFLCPTRLCFWTRSDLPHISLYAQQHSSP